MAYNDKRDNDYNFNQIDVNIEEERNYEDIVKNNPSLLKQLALSLCLISPLMYSILFFMNGNDDMLLKAGVIAFLSTGLLIYSWIDFIKRYKVYRVIRPKKEMSDITKKMIYVVLLFVFGSIVIFVMLFCPAILPILLYLNDDAFMISSPITSAYIFMFIGVELAFLFLSYLNKFYDRKKVVEDDFLLPFVKDYKLYFIVMNIVLVYLAVVHTSVFTYHNITHYSSLHPFGKTYTYNEVKSVKTGFYRYGFLLREKGEFYYNITMNDGTKIKLYNTQTIEEYEKDSYSDYVKLDELIMKYKPIKKGDTKNSQYLFIEDIYVKRLEGIVNNK